MANLFHFTKFAMLHKIELPWSMGKQLPFSMSNLIHLTKFAMVHKKTCQCGGGKLPCSMANLLHVMWPKNIVLSTKKIHSIFFHAL